VSETSGTFGGWSDRLTYLFAEGQLLVAGLAVSLGIVLLWFKPSLPGIPPIAGGIFAALLLLGPPLTGLFVTGARALRSRNMVTVHHINAAQDVREKYYVEPGVWDEKTVDGPSPYRVNDDEAFEVREFDWQEDVGTLRVRGSHLSQMQDSALVTFRTLVYDLHDEFVEKWLELNQARARESKRGLEIQNDFINAQAEADERALSEPPTTISDTWEESLEQVRNDDDLLDVDDLDTYADRAHTSWRPEPVGPEPAPDHAATDGGTEE